MSQNPYATPISTSGYAPQQGPPKNHALGPGIVLLILGILTLLVALIGTRASIYLTMQEADQVPADVRSTQLAGTIVFWALLYFVSGSIGILGGIAMIRARGHRTAFVAAIVACIPCLSPCLILGIPFGIWAIVALNKPETKALYAMNDR